MSEKILVNGITLEEGNIVPLLSKIRYWQNKGVEVTFLGNGFLKKKIEKLGIVHSFQYVEFPINSKIRSKYRLIVESIRRNILCMRYIYRVKNKYDVIYSISSVLDLIIFPYILKKIDKRIRWISVFDNIVPFSDPGNKFIRFLGWLFFQFSLFLLREADIIFAISNDLKEFLISKGFKSNRIVITGNGVEVELIKQAKRSMAYNIDALFVGRINETKGIYDMLEVLKIIRKGYPDFQLAIMGRGDVETESNFQKKIKEQNLKANIQFLGYKSGIEKFTIMKSSKCFWFFSISASESFGIALLEAVCCGLPAFAYNLSSYRDIYKNNEVMLLEKNNYQKAAQAIVALFKKGNFENKKGEKLLAHYTWDSIAGIEYSSFNVNGNYA